MERVFDIKKIIEKVDINESQEVIITFLGTSKNKSLTSEPIKETDYVLDTNHPDFMDTGVSSYIKAEVCMREVINYKSEGLVYLVSDLGFSIFCQYFFKNFQMLFRTFPPGKLLRPNQTLLAERLTQ